MRSKSQSCELCDGEATLYCAADAAHLCWRCDRRVHSANFLVARHVRLATCSSCRSPAALSLSGPGSSDPIRLPLCRSCRPNTSPSAASPAPKVLESWGRGMGLRKPRRCACVAARVAVACGAAVPKRVAMAAAMWYGARVCEGGACGGMALRRLEKCSGVPAKVIVACESRIARALDSRRRRRRRSCSSSPVVVEEGWGECE